MNSQQIEERLRKLVLDVSKEDFIYDLLLSYGLPKASITRLKQGSYDLSDKENTVSWKKRVYFKVEYEADLHSTLMDLAGKSKHDERFIIATDFITLLARDVKTKENLDIPINDLPKHYDFFLPWAGMEKATYQSENPADVKAAERMAKLFDAIRKDNPNDSPKFIHGLNVFLSRLLFCFFAEDTNIFSEGQFTKGVASHTQVDGSDLNNYLDKLFEVLNTRKQDRENIPAYLDEFPYVNGGLFKDNISSPIFTRRSRQTIIDSGELNWSAINPDIFGSMMQAVITPEQRGGLGMHYTSVPNIMKVINPLFLDELYEVFDKGKNEPKKLIKLLERISKIKIFDPACGSGNFLIIAYKELRKLEMKIIRRLIELQKLAKGFRAKHEQLSIIPKSQLELAESYHVDLFSRVQLSQFYGIELDDFAHEIAQLSLWLAEHQMNVEFYDEFGRMNPTLPLKEAGKIVHGNACRIDWESVCPKKNDDEIYILGNPPYLGFQERKKAQKEDMAIVFQNVGTVKRLDYIGCWFKKATDYLKGSPAIKYALVTTNSICQGEQASLLWPYIFSMKQEIFFAHQTFKWTNNAKGNAGVSCNIIGIRNIANNSKFLFRDNRKKLATNINAYLVDGPNIVMPQRTTPLSKLPDMALGSSGIDGGQLMLSEQEKNEMIKVDPTAQRFIRKFYGGGDLLNGKNRYCIWIEDDEVKAATQIPVICERINKCREYRLSAGRDAKKAASVPHRFFYRKYKDGNSIALPMTSSENRLYMPISFIKSGTILSNGVFVVYDSGPELFGILSSKMHFVWLITLSGKLESRIRYSVNLNYNTFPFPKISNQRLSEINQCVFRILEEREKHPEKTLAELYDPDKMPQGLLEAHQANDEVIEKCYRSRPFESDEQRLEYLFKLYKEMLEEEKQKETLFENQKKKRRR